ncbi:hypothetical protein PMZ80_009113 [Knufia obscura]|uniref:IQ calmodulin-binding motif protein n=2 Tax=Knufia TaxID=430999 RepID=A0AAN8I537_9EURO|nr:hypothetical protein PMZ80_009113 [Knufia obscura]KAK5954932.1 hypothetical protein OHC33_003611 [Knufia fluminis]
MNHVKTPQVESPSEQPQIPGLSDDEQERAARLIQKTYRGHRTRRELQGHGLDPTTRWIEAIRDAKYQQITTPRAPEENITGNPAQDKWQRVTGIARHAGADDSTADVSLSEASDSDPSQGRQRSKEEQDQRQNRKALAKEKRTRTAKMMDLQYFLEMVDQKHRYGSSLRKYHQVWKSADTDQNFFYWLDYGDGVNVELEECSRVRLEREQVRYLSREERLNYLVKVDDNGRLIWAKNGTYVWTKDELYRDSVNGIVPTSDTTPEWTHNGRGERDDDSSSYSNSSADEDPRGDAMEAQKSGLEGERYVNEGFHRARGPAKLKHVSAGVLFNHMVRQSLKKGHKWIFVADTSFRLYIGYKQSGAFQHSSFLHGGRILAAGLIKVKDGQLRRLSPLSGHYRPATANFRAFVHSLEDGGVDMSHVSISRSYAVLVGLESYTKTRKKIENAEKAVGHEVDKVVRPEKVIAEEKAKQDHSQSAQKEREYLERQRMNELEHQQTRRKSSRSLSKRLSNAWGRLTGKTVSLDDQSLSDERGIPGTGPEDGVPAPDGHRYLEKK